MSTDVSAVYDNSPADTILRIRRTVGQCHLLQLKQQQQQQRRPHCRDAAWFCDGGAATISVPASSGNRLQRVLNTMSAVV